MNRFLSLLFLLSLTMASHAQPVPAAFAEIENASLLLLGSEQQVVMTKHADKAMIPASTTKLVTGFLALKQWGADHRFHTDFYLSRGSKGEAILVVKGYGDPFLTSEELQILARHLADRLKAKQIYALSHLVLVTDYFQSNVILPGHSDSQNPYDAIPSPLAANFNTVNVKVQAGKWVSAESQTPLTSLAEAWASRPEADLTQGRINLGEDAKRCEQYFAELFSHFLRQEGIVLQQRVQWESQPAEKTELFYRHYNRRTLAEMIQPMMRYSTNFIANQLALMLSAERYGAPATADKVARMMQHDLTEIFGWQNFKLEDGAGLSRQNRLSAQQLVALLQQFKPWRNLLPEVLPQVVAKSGTLIGVTTLAGYIEMPRQSQSVPADWVPFALLINESASYQIRNQITRRLQQALVDKILARAPSH